MIAAHFIKHIKMKIKLNEIQSALQCHANEENCERKFSQTNGKSSLFVGAKGKYF